MTNRHLIGSVALLALLTLATAGARAEGEGKYPDWSGQWFRTCGQPALRPDQAAPQAAGAAQAGVPGALRGQHEGPGRGRARAPSRDSCLPSGMPRMMSGVSAVRVPVLARRHSYPVRGVPAAPHLHRRAQLATEPSPGSPATRSANGTIPTATAATTRSTSRRAICADRAYGTSPACRWPTRTTQSSRNGWRSTRGANNLRVEMTTTDGSLTRPWSVVKTFRRITKVWWTEDNCPEGQAWVTIGKEDYYDSADGTIMPTKKDQPPPDLRHFRQSKK